MGTRSINLLLTVCAIAGIAVSFFDGIAGGVIISVVMFLAADRAGISVKTAELILCIAIIFLSLTIMSASLSLLIAPIVAVAAASALYVAYSVISDFGKEVLE